MKKVSVKEAEGVSGLGLFLVFDILVDWKPKWGLWCWVAEVLKRWL